MDGSTGEVTTPGGRQGGCDVGLSEASHFIPPPSLLADDFLRASEPLLAPPNHTLFGMEGGGDPATPPKRAPLSRRNTTRTCLMRQPYSGLLAPCRRAGSTLEGPPLAAFYPETHEGGRQQPMRQMSSFARQVSTLPALADRLSSAVPNSDDTLASGIWDEEGRVLAMQV